MAREAKFEFSDEKSLLNGLKAKEEAKHTVTINGKVGTLVFSMDYIRDKGLSGSMVKLYADPSKKALGWKILKETSLGDLDGYRKLKIYSNISKKGNHQKRCQLSVKPLLAMLNAQPKTYKKLKINTYKAPTLLSQDLDYVEIK